MESLIEVVDIDLRGAEANEEDGIDARTYTNTAVSDSTSTKDNSMKMKLASVGMAENKDRQEGDDVVVNSSDDTTSVPPTPPPPPAAITTIDANTKTRTHTRVDDDSKDDVNAKATTLPFYEKTLVGNSSITRSSMLEMQ